jgi:hypothetical protein
MMVASLRVSLTAGMESAFHEDGSLKAKLYKDDYYEKGGEVSGKFRGSIFNAGQRQLIVEYHIKLVRNRKPQGQ